MVPTAVLMKNGEEVGRISGYWGREGFFKMLAHIRSIDRIAAFHACSRYCIPHSYCRNGRHPV